MQFRSILAPRSPLLAGLILALGAWMQPALAQSNTNDDVLLQMKQAFQRSDKTRLSSLLPLAQGHALEAWAAYWELKARLEDATPDEVQAFFSRYAGTYQEDRLRNDWLMLLGQRRQWEDFLAVHSAFRMQDDREVQCYAVLAENLRSGQASADQGAQVRANWLAQRDLDDGCLRAAERMIAARQMSPNDAWRKARQAMEANRADAARAAVMLVAPESLPAFEEMNAGALKFLLRAAPASSRASREIVLMALIRMAVADPDAAATQLDAKWSSMFSPEERNWAWGVIGRQAAGKLSPQASIYFAKVARNGDLNDDQLGWKVRAALRAGQWKDVAPAVDAMSDASRQDAIWTYWKARALNQAGGDMRRAEARELLQRIASTRGFYELLALDELGQRAQLPPRPAPLTTEEKNAARTNPGLQRGLYAIGIGLRSEGVREWNYATNLHEPGGMNDRALLAAADLACQRMIYDRCINTSERTKGFIDMAQRFPMPFHDTVLRKSADIGLDPAYVYGLIRQESRFIMDARSGVGASGLMQVMPATARWTANKIGLAYSPSMINDRETNIILGTNYLKLALDDFDGSMPLAAAAYNAGPGRPRNWRNGPVIDAAIWAENVPFTETRDYVKKVLANTTNYAMLISGQPQSLRERLGRVGPRPANEPEPNKDLP